MLKRMLVLLLTLMPAVALAEAAKTPSAVEVTSPDGKLTLRFSLSAAGAPRYSVRLEGQLILRESRLGLVRDDADFTSGLRLVSASAVETVKDHYEILTAKRRVNDYLGHRRIVHLATSGGQKLDVVFQVSNDGVAFRYSFPETSAALRRIKDEVSSFSFRPGTRAWLQPMAVAQSGWCRANPSYEELYEKGIPVGTPSPLGAGWIYPALFRSGDTWLLVSETGLGRGYCGTRLRSDSPDGEYSVGLADPREVIPGEPAHPESKLPWLTPWRVIVIGSLKTIVESTLGIDLANPAPKAAADWIKPGKASWSWVLLKDDQTVYDVQKQFVDYAGEMGWRYCLVDALWDKQIGYEKIKELADYARTKGVGLLLWYNSAGSWNDTPQTPRNLMVTHESRVKEFARLKEMNIAGVKIDFFGGDGQSMIGYYQDILEDAAAYNLLVNFHGATLPRGWQRTYPHLMTMEAIRGFEYVTFAQAFADQQALHAAMLPFTRNVFDPMDYTPMVLDRIPRIERRTTSTFELALAVLFTSGIQHYAEIPEGMAKVPDYVRTFVKGIPSVWDDVRFIDGFPGEFAVIARQGAGRWYVAGVNAASEAKALTLDLSGLPVRGKGTLIGDGDGGLYSFRQEAVSLDATKRIPVTLAARGGFVITLE